MSDTGIKKLERTREGRMLAGVCSGLGSYFGLDFTLVRLIFVVISFFGGAGLLLYVVAWAVIPEEGERESIVEGLINKNRQS